jgi:hypothetical protein
MKKQLQTKNRSFKKRLGFITLGVFIATLSFSQTIIFSDEAGDNVTLGTEEQVSMVSNPLLDGVNGSSQVLLSDGAAWEAYTITCSVPITASNNKLYISFYNPNGLTDNQVQLNFENPNQQYLTEAHPAGSADGWYERVIDLSSFEGETLNWIWIAPSAEEAGKVYFDNIYLDDASNKQITMPFVLSTTGIIFMDEAGEGVELGTEEHVSLVDNPMKDDVNDSETVLKSDATASWSGYTITCNIPVRDTAAYLYISMYNPDDALENQIQVNFATPNQQWLTEVYPDGATTGWYTRVIDLTAFVGDTLNWMWLAPTAGQARLSYMDNIYLAGEPETTSIGKLYPDNGDVYYSNGVLWFKETQSDNAEVSIFDASGRILHKERAEGNTLSINPSISDGIYIIRVVENNQLKLVKKLFINK